MSCHENGLLLLVGYDSERKPAHRQAGLCPAQLTHANPSEQTLSMPYCLSTSAVMLPTDTAVSVCSVFGSNGIIAGLLLCPILPPTPEDELDLKGKTVRLNISIERHKGVTFSLMEGSFESLFAGWKAINEQTNQQETDGFGIERLCAFDNDEISLHTHY